MNELIERTVPYALSFLSALALTYVLTPIVRELNRRLGMVDRPDARRINKVPIPRGGGLAIFLGVVVSYSLLLAFGDRVSPLGGDMVRYVRCSVIAFLVVALGYADDKFSLPPKVKLAGQIAAGFLTWAWANLGFNDIWPSIPAWLDCCLTVFWIIGAVNAFNLIDGLDGLATGLAFIATIGMAGALFCIRRPTDTVFYFAFGGALLGFLRYNYNPASVFLGDCGSMYIGYVLATLPLFSHAEHSFLVSIGVPMLAMGVPIFDTSLAIFRRSVRHLLNRRPGAKEGQVMQADVDHLHHRLLRETGLNQRKTAWLLYAFALLLVAFGLVGLILESRSAGLWILAVVIVSVIVFRDAARIELLDAGRLLDSIAHGGRTVARGRWARIRIPFFVLADLAIAVAVFFGVTFILDKPLFVRRVLTVALPVRILPIFFLLTAFGVYRTIWPRAMLSNYIRLFAACALGSLIGGVGIFYLPGISNAKLITETVLFALLPFFLMSTLRVLRYIVRDAFYQITVKQLKGRKDVSRILVYGAGLRYRTFRRELVRKSASTSRVIVGLLDDDLLLRGHRIGGQRVLGPLAQAPEFIVALNVDAVVVACEVTEERLRDILAALKPTGVRVSYFHFEETEVN